MTVRSGCTIGRAISAQQCAAAPCRQFKGGDRGGDSSAGGQGVSVCDAVVNVGVLGVWRSIICGGGGVLGRRVAVSACLEGREFCVAV